MADASPTAITVLIPTLALRARGGVIRRALDSIRTQSGVAARALIVVNGAEKDPDLLAELRRDPVVDLVEIADRGIPAALRAGRALVATRYFTALDDDDEFLPGALASRVAALEADPGLDAVVTNGIVRSASGDSLHRPGLATVRRDPLRAMIQGNWLLPGSWTCRSDRVGDWLFEGMPEHRECTWIGLQLAIRAQVAFLDAPTVVWYSDTPAAAHRSLAYAMGQVPAMGQLLSLPLPRDVQGYFRAAVRQAMHEVAHRLLVVEGDRRAAWRWHLQSLRGEGGLRHLLFSRKFLYPRAWLTEAPELPEGGGPA